MFSVLCQRRIQELPAYPICSQIRFVFCNQLLRLIDFDRSIKSTLAAKSKARHIRLGVVHSVSADGPCNHTDRWRWQRRGEAQLPSSLPRNINQQFFTVAIVYLYSAHVSAFYFHASLPGYRFYRIFRVACVCSPLGCTCTSTPDIQRDSRGKERIMLRYVSQNDMT